MSTSLLERITIEPGKCGGRPCIRGLRLRVMDVLDLLSHGASHAKSFKTTLNCKKTTFAPRSPGRPPKPAIASWSLPEHAVTGGRR
jgi:hypothetical protein